MGEKEVAELSKVRSPLGKIGLSLMVIGMIITYVDGIRLAPTVPIGYQFYEHPEIHIPIIGIMIAFIGTAVFVHNFRKGRNVI